jgi:hypothetical protein
MDVLRCCRPPFGKQAAYSYQPRIPKQTIKSEQKEIQSCCISIFSHFWFFFFFFPQNIREPHIPSRLQPVRGGSQRPLVASSIAELVAKRGSEVIENSGSTRAWYTVSHTDPLSHVTQVHNLP